jgi:hypothetical protein
MRTRLLVSGAAALVLVASAARADDCPPGSVFKSQEGFSWCEPTVCTNDGQCSPAEVCRPVPLCMQVGTVQSDAAALGDASKRLVVTQRCAPDKTCPQTTICSDLGRCVSKAAAEKMGILGAAPSAAPAPGGGGTTANKSACGCDVPGSTPGGSRALALLGASVAVSVLARAARRAPRPRSR